MKLSDIQPYSKLPFHGVILPTFIISEEDKKLVDLKPDCTHLEFITALCRIGWKDKVANKISKEKQEIYKDRIKLELDTIETLNFTNYILMVWDICRFADSKNIPRGPGRGSVSSSLVCNLINITDVDPIENGLFFTRFLSKSRAKKTIVEGVSYVDGGLVADIDMDFCFYRRQEVLDYINLHYPGQTAKLLNTQTFTSRILIKDVLKVYEGLVEDQVKDVSDMIEDDTGQPVSVEKSLWGDEKWQKGDKNSDWPPNERFVEWAKNHKESVEIAMDLEGLTRGEGMHASAVAICAMPIRQLMPLQLSSEKESITGFDMYDVQEIALKFDILGLKTLSVIEDCCKVIGIDWRKIDVHDPCIYRELQDFTRRYGVFQLETFAQGNAAAKVKPKTFEQLTAVLAIARPGAFAYLDQFSKYVNEGIYNSIHPLIDDILKPTGGVCLYQEQYLAMLIRVGMTPDEAENARKVLGKKLKDKVADVIAKIEETCKANNQPKELVDLLVKIAYDSGGYSFALAHASAYAKITAYTLYLKSKYPLQFYWAWLQMTRNESEKYDKLAIIQQEMTQVGIRLLPPSFDKSEVGFKIEGKDIRFALGMIRGVSDKNVEKLELFRVSATSDKLNKFKIFQALKNAGLNVGIGSALIQAGCMEGYDRYINKEGKSYNSRSRLVLELNTWHVLTDAEKTHSLTIGPLVKWDVLQGVKYLVDVAKHDNGKPLLKETRFTTIKKKYQPYKEIYLQNSRNERLANYYYERRVLGYSHSENLKDIFADYIEGLMTVAEAKALPVNSTCRLIGFVFEKPYTSKTKKGNDQLKLNLVDETGMVVVKSFNDQIELIREQNGRLCQEDDLIIANVKKKEGDTMFGNIGMDHTCITIQTCKIYMKLSELKETKETKKKAAEKVVT